MQPGGVSANDTRSASSLNNVLREELYGSPLRIEPRPPGWALDEAEVSALGRDLQRDGPVGRARDALRGNERVVRCREEQQRNPHALDEAPAGALRVVIRRAAESVDAGGERIVELEQRACPPDPIRVRGSGELLQLGQGLPLQGPEEASAVDPAPEPGAIQALRGHREVERNAQRHRGLDLPRHGCALLTQPLHQHVAAQRASGQHDPVRLAARAPDQLAEIARFAGVVGAHQTVHVAGATAKVEGQGAPTAGLRLREQAADVVRGAGAFEAVEQEEQGRVPGARHPIHVDEIAIGQLPTLARQRHAGARSEDRPEDGHEVGTEEPARGCVHHRSARKRAMRAATSALLSTMGRCPDPGTNSTAPRRRWERKYSTLEEGRIRSPSPQRIRTGLSMAANTSPMPGTSAPSSETNCWTGGEAQWRPRSRAKSQLSRDGRW